VTLEEFTRTLDDERPPDASAALVALWYDARGDWDRAHIVAQDIDGPTGAWVHAYLHRKEGDAGNAGYWYSRAGRKAASGSLAREWHTIVTTLLAATS
jgi:hypothetical protein